MKIVTVELVGSHGGTLDVRTISLADDEEGESKINEVVMELARDCILHPGDTIRVSEYQ